MELSCLSLNRKLPNRRSRRERRFGNLRPSVIIISGVNIGFYIGGLLVLAVFWYWRSFLRRSFGRGLSVGGLFSRGLSSWLPKKLTKKAPRGAQFDISTFDISTIRHLNIRHLDFDISTFDIYVFDIYVVRHLNIRHFIPASKKLDLF